MRPPARALYVSRFPPSPSGVALYARDLLDVLEMIAPVDVVSLPPDPRDSQSWVLAARLVRRTSAWVRANPGGLVMLELAGRGQAEFWCAWWLTRRRTASVIVTVHDVPAVSGGAFFTRALDRRGLRRLAHLLSTTLGRAAEGSTLGRATAVFALSHAGAAELTRVFRLPRPALALPHVMRTGPDSVDKEAEVFVPGYLGSARDVLPLLEALPDCGPPWRLTVGSCPEAVAEDLRAAAQEAGIGDRMTFTGFLAEPDLVRCFERAAIVVRWRHEGWAGDSSLAVSGPTIRAMGSGCAIVTNDTRGAWECLESAGALVVPDGDDGAARVRAAVVDLASDAARRAAVGARARAHVADEHSPAVLAGILHRVAEGRGAGG